MISGILEITTPGKYLSINRGLIEISEKGSVVGTVPFDSINSVLISSIGVTLSTNLIVKLSENLVPIFICGADYLPKTLITPLVSATTYSTRFDLQLKASKPFIKTIWSSIVKQKILNQAYVLDRFGFDAQILKSHASGLRSGDPLNREATAAQYYWKNIFEKDFRRSDEANNINAFLNYGYTVLRSAVARSIYVSGLDPYFGLHHSNKSNPLALVDDFVEPYRPVVDLIIKSSDFDFEEGLTPKSKEKLAAVLNLDIVFSNETSTLYNSMFKLLASYVHSLKQKKDLVEFPNFKEFFINY